MVENIRFSQIFYYKEHKVDDRIVYPFCNKFHNKEIYSYIKNIENILRDKLVGKICKFFDVDGNEVPMEYSNIPGYIEWRVGQILEKEFGMKNWINGKTNWPDHYDSNNIIAFDTKCVLCHEGQLKINDVLEQVFIPTYSNACGPLPSVIKELNDHYVLGNKSNMFANSFVIFSYYNELGEILEIKLIPIIYCLNISKNGKFRIKSAGDTKNNGQTKNAQVTISLPSFTQKTGLLTFEEKELDVMTTLYNENMGI